MNLNIYNYGIPKSLYLSMKSPNIYALKKSEESTPQYVDNPDPVKPAVANCDSEIMYSLTTDPGLVEQARNKYYDIQNKVSTIGSERIVNSELHKWDGFILECLKELGIRFVYDKNRNFGIVGEFDETNKILIPIQSYKYDRKSRYPMFNVSGADDYKSEVINSVYDNFNYQKDQYYKETLKRKNVDNNIYSNMVENSFSALSQLRFEGMLNCHLMLIIQRCNILNNRLTLSETFYVDAIDHELSHAVFQSRPIRLFNLRSYSGPSEEDIKNELVRDLLGKNMRAEMMEGVVREYVSSQYRRQITHEEILGIMKLKASQGKYLEAKSNSDFLFRCADYGYRVLFLGKLGEGTTKQEMIAKMPGIFDDTLKDFLCSALKDQRPDVLSRSLSKIAMKNDAEDSWWTYKEKKYGMEYMISADEYSYNNDKYICVAVDEQRCIEEAMDISRRLSGKYIDILILNTIFGELLARKVDSLMNVYLGPDNTTNFRLYDEDLKTFEAMTYKGAPMFKKAIEKYRLGMQMLQDGVKWEDVTKKLQYATNYEYNGKAYLWPDNEANIKIEDK